MKVVIALGGNALGKTANEQLELVKKTAIPIVDLIEEGNHVVIAHGNGPQVGMINKEMSHVNMPFPECGAMSQGYIGYHLQNAIKNELLNRGINKNVVTIITQVEVDRFDSGFKNPTKPIGEFLTKTQALELEKTKGYTMIEDSGRGYRRVVPSPKPVDIVEKEVVNNLVDTGTVVITVGGGGIPVYKDNGYHGIAAVIDKDFASSKLAELVDADILCILTAVNNVAINFGKPNQIDLREVNIDYLNKLIKEGHFAKGSMLPKVEAAIRFVEATNNKVAVIASLENAKEALKFKTGTIIKK
ncbi:MAG: carbamate kinase [Tenericutes bacterium 4572_104]|nr:MAG: carbamate kinase [Tenericutes bacterium 4572_104]